MLASLKVKEAERLLAEGQLSQRKIALAVGISRASVAAIASGRRRDHSQQAPWFNINVREPLGPIARCPGCGGLAHMPCRLCRVREFKERERQHARLLRRKARESALRRLLMAVANASRERNSTGCTDYLPADFAGGASDCK